jgi:hypothetical protein
MHTLYHCDKMETLTCLHFLIFFFYNLDYFTSQQIILSATGIVVQFSIVVFLTYTTLPLISSFSKQGNSNLHKKAFLLRQI